MRIDEENEKKNDALKGLSKAQAEIQLWKSKYEVEALGRIDELEGGRAKLNSRVQKAKADDLMAELDACNSECRNFNAERFRLKAALDEANEQLDIVRRENKNLADEVKDLLDQLGDG